MLIGIKNTNLDPVWIKTLPSGVAVYRSVFRDIWRSNIIFAGPHKTFTDANRVCTINYSGIEPRPIARNDGWSDDLLMHDQEYSVVINKPLCVMDAFGSESVEQCMGTELVSDMLHHSNGPLGSEMTAADLTGVGEPQYSPLLSIAQMLITDRVRHDLWVQLYKDIVHQLFCRSSNWEKIDRLLQLNDTILFTFTDLGYSEKPVAWGTSKIIAVTDRSMSISNIRKLAHLGPSILAIIRRNSGNVSVIYAADEFYINNPERFAQVTNNV